MSTLNHNVTQCHIVGDAHLYYQDAGNPQGMAVLLLHGGFGTLEDFRSIVDPLLNDFRIIAMDSRGQGQSTPGHAVLTYEQMQTDAEHLLAHLGIKEAAVVGFSDGGMTGYKVAMSGNVNVVKLVAIGAPWRNKDLIEMAGPLSKISAGTRAEKFPESYQLYKKLNPEIDFSTLVPRLQSMWLDSSKSGGYPDKAISVISCPLLIIRGDQDHLFSLESAVELRSAITHANFLNVPFAGHEVHIEQPEIVQNLIYWFLAGMERG